MYNLQSNSYMRRIENLGKSDVSESSLVLTQITANMDAVYLGSAESRVICSHLQWCVKQCIYPLL